ncbi:MAG: DNA repair protein RecO, partial [Pseudomonadota bacterium]|nr:DNA repair protein RecO [Pseudomonadota bacterium]
MEWDAPAIVLDTRAYGEGGALITVLTEEHGLYRALARGGGSKSQASLWQPGNVVQARWIARLADQLGSVSAELMHAAAAATMDEPLPLAILASACAVAEGALPEREACPMTFAGLAHVLSALSSVEDALPMLIRW